MLEGISYATSMQSWNWKFAFPERTTNVRSRWQEQLLIQIAAKRGEVMNGEKHVAESSWIVAESRRPFTAIHRHAPLAFFYPN
jgi:hypothetical protein